MRLAKFDELDSLINGMLYVETNNPHECYYWINPTEDECCEKRFFDFSDPYPFLVSQHGSWHCGCISHTFILKSSILFCYFEIQ
jgi:type II pantothenate kinase